MADTEGEGGTSFKRRRVALACKSCRNRKTRCNGARPTCLPCTELGLACTYEQPANNDVTHQAQSQREHHRDSRLEALEDTIRQLVQSMKGSGRPDIPGSSTGIAAESVDMLNTIKVGSSHAERHRDADDEGAMSTEEDVTDGMAAISGDISKARRYFGPSSNIAFLRSVSLTTGAVLHNLYLRDRHAAMPNESLLTLPPPQRQLGTPESALLTQTTDAFTLPEDEQAIRLIDLFFSDTGLLFPFVHEKYVRRRWDYARLKGAQGMSSHFVALLNAIFAMAAHIDNAADLGPVEHRPGIRAETFFRRAHLLLGNSQRPNVERVQCLLLMCQYRQGTDKADETCALHAEATRVAIQLGLHVQHLPPFDSLLETEIRARTWSNCVMLDRVLSMTFGHPQLLSKDSVSVIRPQDLDRLDPLVAAKTNEVTPSGDSDAAIFYLATSKLYAILGETLSVLYGDNAQLDSEQDLCELLRLGMSFERSLFTWKRDLPHNLALQPWLESDIGRLERAGFQPITIKLSTVLHLRYLNVCILKDRPILTWFLKCIYGPMRDGFVPAAVDVHFMDIAQAVLNRIEKNAREAIEVLWTMSSQFQALGAWWFSSYYLLNSCLVVFGCLLIRSNNQAESEKIIPETERLSSLESSLRKGTFTSRKIMKARGRVSRIQETLDRICNTAAAILSTLRQSNQSASIASTQRAMQFDQTLHNEQYDPHLRVESQFETDPRTSTAQARGLGRREIPPEASSSYTMPDDLSLLFGADVDIIDTLGDVSFDLNDFTSL